MRAYENLTDHDFELLIAGLLRAETGDRYEAFARGPDKGVDLRHIPGPGAPPYVVQCKHYPRSSFSTLRSAVRKEAQRLTDLGAQFRSYTFVTSMPLTGDRKDKLLEDLAPWVKSAEHLLGQEDVELLLDRHHAIERAHVKLWLHSGAQLHALLNSPAFARGKLLLEQVERVLPRYVQGKAFGEALRLLDKSNVCLIAGPPGIGKTTLAQMLLAEKALQHGFEVIDVSFDIEEAYSAHDPDVPQLFYYDDFLGRTLLSEGLRKNEDQRLISFINRVQSSPKTRFVLTTREYILQQARQLSQVLGRASIGDDRFLLTLDRYSRLDRARILYSHIYWSDEVEPAAVNNLLTDKAYTKIIDHPNYNPRLIEWITGLGGRRLGADENSDFVAFAVSVLDHPEEVWLHAFDSELNDHERALLIAMASMPLQVATVDIETAFDALCAVLNLDVGRQAFKRALAVLDDTFLRSSRSEGREFLTFSNPSVVDFLRGYLRDARHERRAAMSGAVFFEQVAWLIDELADEMPDERALIIEAIERTFASPNVSWHAVHIDDDPKPTLQRTTGDLAQRLAAVLDAREELSISDDVVDRLTMSVRAGWEAGRGDKRWALELVKGTSDPDTIEAAKKLLTSQLYWAQAWDQLAEFRKMHPEAFTADEWNGFVDHMQRFVTEQLDPADSFISTRDDLGELERVAGTWGVAMDPDAYEAFDEHVWELERQREQDMDPDDDDEDRYSYGRDDRAEGAIAALFERLAE